MKGTDQIAEKETRLCAIALFNDETDSRAGTILAHIRSAIEKATEQLREQLRITTGDLRFYVDRRDELARKLRAAHASEQGDPWGLRDCKPDPETGGL